MFYNTISSSVTNNGFSNKVVFVQSIIQEAQNCKIPWNEVAKPAIGEWLSVFAKAKGMCMEFLLTSCFPTGSALMGNSVVKIFKTTRSM